MNPGENNEFDKQLRERFEGFRPKAPDGLWDKIAAQLEAEEPRSVVPMRRRLPAWWMAAAAMLLMVCGVLYWQNRPVPVTYLHVQADAVEAPEKVVVEPSKVVESSKPVETAEPVTEPLDLERLRRVFAKRNRKVEEPSQVAARERQPEEAPAAATTESQPLAMHEPLTSSPGGLLQWRDTLESAAIEIAGVPAIEPLLVLEDEEETMLASTEATRQAFGLSNILNYVVGTVDQRDEKLVTFSNDEEGSLKLDFNFGLAKNKKKKLK